VPLVLHTLGSDEALNLGGLGVRLRTLLLGDNFATNDELANIILLGETKEAADLGGTLGTKALGLNSVGETRDILLALLDDGEGKHSQVLGDDAATDRLSLALTGATGSVAGVAIGEEELDTGREHLWTQVSANVLALLGAGLTYDTLLHGKALLVIATGDADNVAFPLIA